MYLWNILYVTCFVAKIRLCNIKVVYMTMRKRDICNEFITTLFFLFTILIQEKYGFAVNYNCPRLTHIAFANHRFLSYNSLRNYFIYSLW